VEASIGIVLLRSVTPCARRSPRRNSVFCDAKLHGSSTFVASLDLIGLCDRFIELRKLGRRQLDLHFLFIVHRDRDGDAFGERQPSGTTTPPRTRAE
jgi:hypothetical protein